MSSVKRAPLIMLDGPEWVGKTTQLQLAADALRAQRHQVYTTRINGGTPIGEALRNVFLNPDLPRPKITDLHIMLATYYALIEDLQERRQHAPGIYLMDRSPLSMFAYHVHGNGLPRQLGEPATSKTLQLFEPDLVICYMAPEAVLEKRRQQRQAATKARLDFVESQPAAYMRRVVAGYHEACKKYGAVAIDASGTPEAVHQTTLELIMKVVNSN
jgi:dTMP kinase